MSQLAPHMKAHRAEPDHPCNLAAYVDESVIVRSDGPINAMSIDVEDYFQVSAFEQHIDRSQWQSIPSRLERNIGKILLLLDDNDIQATFFTLGWVAENYPEIVKVIASQGHEIGSHSFEHRRVCSQSKREFLADASRTKKLLEDISGNQVVGYRAPSFSIGQECLWAHDILQEAGYVYSSSIYPIRHDHYGLPAAPRFPFRFRKHGLIEIPLTSMPFAGLNWPGSGGGYFRLLPMAYSRWVIRHVNNVDKMPAIFYFHPWELDPEQPRVNGIPMKTRFRHYVNLDKFELRLARILREFRWGRLDEVFRDVL